MDTDDREVGEQVELLASHHPGANEMDAYERVLGDAMNGDRTLFARQDYVEEAWRIVDPVLKKTTPVYEYEARQLGAPAKWTRMSRRRVAGRIR
jgi:glucose-6-phosphate 1-dehydrogenase